MDNQEIVIKAITRSTIKGVDTVIPAGVQSGLVLATSGTEMATSFGWLYVNSVAVHSAVGVEEDLLLEEELL